MQEKRRNDRDRNCVIDWQKKERKEKVKRKIKMVGLDLDGTLLNDKKELLPYTKDVLRRAVDQGIIVLVATGRPWLGVPEELRNFPGMRYALTSNGARIIDRDENRVIEEKLLSPEQIGRAHV